MKSVHEVITIVDNDFVTIAPGKPEVAEGNEIVFVLTRPAVESTGFIADGDGAD